MKNLPRYFPFLLVLLAAASRLLPHPPNATPIAAMALFGGAYLGKRYALWTPLTALAVSDLILGWHATWPFVYGAFLLTGLIGLLLRGHRRPGFVLGAALLSSFLFFTLTNFGVWLAGGLYPHTFPGLLACYSAALPFFRNTLLGDILFTAALFGLQELVIRRTPIRVESVRM